MFGFDTDTLHRIRGCFAQFPQIHKVLLYGSRAMGTQHPGSDVDITLIGKNLNRKNILLPLSDALDELLLPVTFDCSIFIQLENPELIRHILERGVCFYEVEVKVKSDWSFKKIGDLMEVARGGSPRPIKKYLTNSNDGINWIKISDATASEKYIYQTEQKIDRSGLSKTRMVHEGDFLLSNSMSFGRPYIMKTSGCIHDGWLVLKPTNPNLLNQDYLYYLLGSPLIYQEFDRLAAGSTVRNLNIGLVSSVKIPVPPLPEQAAIVAILDQAFAAIDQAKAKLERNIANAKELFQSKLNAIFSQKGEGWVETTLKQVASKIGSGATPRGGQAAYKTSGIALIRSMNVHDEGFKPKNLAFIDDQQADKLSNVEIREDDILLNITGASVARCCVVDSSYLPARVNQHVSIIRLKEGQIDHDYLHYFLTSRSTKSALLEIGEQGATRQAITKAQIENFVISYPESLVIQRDIVIALKKSEQSLKELGKIYNSKLRKFDELKKSLLQKAFTGALTDAQSFVA